MNDAVQNHTKDKREDREIILILDNIRSVLNVGAIFRTADAIGVSKIYLVGNTPAPIDRFGRARKDLHKTALGAEDTVSWEQVEDVTGLIASLRHQSFTIVALEQGAGSVDYKDAQVVPKMAIIVGNEVDGVTHDLRVHSDIVAEIPMRGQKESLNVTSATAIVLFRWFDGA